MVSEKALSRQGRSLLTAETILIQCYEDRRLDNEHNVSMSRFRAHNLWLKNTGYFPVILMGLSKLHADVEAAYGSINFPLAPLITAVRVAAPSLPRALSV